MKMKVYISGIGGLGNCLFQIMTGIIYCEKFDDCELVLLHSNLLNVSFETFESQQVKFI